MQKTLFAVALVCSFVCCNSNTNKTRVVKTMDSSPADSACYSYVQNKDTIRLSIIITGNHFTGNLSYQLKEKDRNSGTLSGTVNGNILIADYSFSSEGMLSVRQVAFLKKPDGLQEGFGELVSTDNRIMFKDPHKIRFTGFLLAPTACR